MIFLCYFCYFDQMLLIAQALFTGVVLCNIDILLTIKDDSKRLQINFTVWSRNKAQPIARSLLTKIPSEIQKTCFK